ncbi:type I restriction endonuclease subunit R [Methylophaga nitratireducenticrescens]|uniref:type I restriction endonuclease subunit R n=1 Tax=Methylophaga nitratireducenticrescens TaxID=754476 RepID=UPI000CDBF649|nr:type I restriction endonuclease subunit R [Methylophaga nitratireducenticrescens]AUZ83788.1 deoxyribonuclease HsdR [Methylophaga nitratireducenticrescens]
MFQDEIDKVEQPTIEQLVKLGWTYVTGVSLAPLLPSDGSPAGERGYYRDVVLVQRLEATLRRLNPWISDENLRKVSRELTHPIFAALMEYNQAIYKMLVGNISVEQDLGKGRKGQTVKIIDFEDVDNNEFLCCNQFKVEGINQKNIIPDIVCFVNGLPLAVIECKSPYLSSNPIAEGIDQLRRYANLRQPENNEGAQRLFWYNQLMVSTSRDHAKVGTISSMAQHYGDWKDAYPFTDSDISKLLNQANSKVATAKNLQDVPSPEYLTNAEKVAFSLESNTPEINAQQRLLMGVFTPENFLDLIQNFIVYEAEEGRLIKKFARYQQFRAVKKVVERLKNGETRKDKSGVVWHTQGSGKSLTMVMLALKMRRDPTLQQYKLVFVTDRTQLDGQLTKTFVNAQDETINNAGSVTKLRELLQNDASDIVTATVQKFQDAEEEGNFSDLNPSGKIIVLADEAHRTQFGNLGATINAALPNAPKIGFTGTPLLNSQKMDQAFGGYIDKYKINQAVEDGATVRIIYEGRQVKTDVVGSSLDVLFDEYFKDKSKEEKLEIKKKYGVERAVREAPARIRWVCIDLLKHYREHIQPNGFKAMIVVGSRHAATEFKKQLDELQAPPSEVIISGSHNDLEYIAKHSDKTAHKLAIDNFKKPLDESPLSFLIVKDMLLTGFDAPIAQVMYIDRSLKDHTLMQAIARVNRTYKGKSAGFIVDYFGLSDDLSSALKAFSNDDVEGTYYTLKDEIPKLKAAQTKIKQFLSPVTGNDVDDYVMYLKDEDLRHQFDILFKRFAKQLDIILPDASAKAFIPDLKLWGKIQNAAKNKYRDDSLDISDAGEKVKRLVDEHIISTGVDPKIPPVDLMAANFEETLEKIHSKESRASEIESAIKHHITVNLEEDPEYYKSLSLRLRDIIEKTDGKWEIQLELLKDMLSNIKTEYSQQAKDLNLSDTEFAFYNSLMGEVTRHNGNEILDDDVVEEVRETSQALVKMFDEATQIVDFFNKPNQIKHVKKEIKRTLIDCTFADKALINAMQDKFVELAKTKFS